MFIKHSKHLLGVLLLFSLVVSPLAYSEATQDHFSNMSTEKLLEQADRNFYSHRYAKARSFSEEAALRGSDQGLYY